MTTWPRLLAAAVRRAAHRNDSSCAGARLSDPADQRHRAVSRRRFDRRARAHCGDDDVGEDRPEPCGREQDRRHRHDRRRLCGARHAGRLHAVRQFARRRAEHSLRAADIQPGRRLRADWLDRRWAADRADHQRPAAVQVAGGIDRCREGEPEERQFRHLRPGLLAGDGAGAAQYGGQDRHRRRPVSRLRRRGARDGRRRDPGRIRLPARKPSRWSTTARCARWRSRRPNGSRPGPMCRRSRNWATRSTSAASSVSPRRPRRRSRSSNISTSSSTRWCSPTPSRRASGRWA